MNYRRLGKTDMDVSILSFGASSLGSVFRDINEADGIRTVHAAVDGGINFIDVSPYYGLTKAETVLGKAIRQIKRDRFFLSTKAGRYGADRFDYSYNRIMSSLDESLGRLQTDYVDILFLHDIEFVPLHQVVEEALPALHNLKKQGKTRFIGITGLPMAALRKASNAMDIDCVMSYCHYALNDTALIELLPWLEKTHTGIINASPLSMGLLGNRDLPSWHPADEEIRKYCKQAASYCQENGINLAKLAIQFSVSNERISSTLVSTATPDNIVKNMVWAEEPIDRAAVEKVLAILAPIHNHTWPSGLPEYSN